MRCSFVLHLLSHGASWRRTYLQGIDNAESIATVHARKAPMIPASTGLRRLGRSTAGIAVGRSR
jgi:hypothetical protein